MLVLRCPATPPDMCSQIFEYMEYADVVLTPTKSSFTLDFAEKGDGEAVSAQAHKSILSSVSPFLKEMFESNPDSHQIILPDVSIHTIVRILKLIYTGSCECESQAEICEIIKVIEMLHISSISSFNVYTRNMSANIPSQLKSSYKETLEEMDGMEEGKQEQQTIIYNAKELLQDNLVAENCPPSLPQPNKRLKRKKQVSQKGSQNEGKSEGSQESCLVAGQNENPLDSIIFPINENSDKKIKMCSQNSSLNGNEYCVNGDEWLHHAIAQEEIISFESEECLVIETPRVYSEPHPSLSTTIPHYDQFGLEEQEHALRAQQKDHAYAFTTRIHKKSKQS